MYKFNFFVENRHTGRPKKTWRPPSERAVLARHRNRNWGRQGAMDKKRVSYPRIKVFHDKPETEDGMMYGAFSRLLSPVPCLFKLHLPP